MEYEPPSRPLSHKPDYSCHIFLYPNPFSLGLLNLIALALPWRWQATYRTEP